MFSRYVLFSDAATVANHFDARIDVSIEHTEALGLRYNIAAGSVIPVILSGHARQRTLVSAIWDAAFAGPLATAQSLAARHISEDRDLGKLFQRKRCLIPINGFYVWKKLSDTVSLPFYFRILDDDLPAVAGIYSENGAAGLFPEIKGVHTAVCAIETSANELIEPLSPTMPAFVHPEDFGAWLDPLYENPQVLLKKLSPVPTVKMSGYRVGNKVNSPDAQDASLVEPIP